MYPEQQPAPLPGNHYEFIMNPQKPKKAGLLNGMGGDPFITKIIFIVGGTVILIIVAALLVNFLFGSKTNLDTLVGLTQREQEIVRLAGLGKDATSQEIKNSAINTQVSLKSHQNKWLAFMNSRGRELKSEELNLKKNAQTDQRLASAKQTSTFDTTYNTVMRTELETYAGALQSAYKGASIKQEKDLLSNQYGDVVLLLKQWPAATLGLASY